MAEGGASVQVIVESVNINGLPAASVDNKRAKEAVAKFLNEVASDIRVSMEESEAGRIGFDEDSYPNRSSHNQQRRIADSISVRSETNNALGEMLIESRHAAPVNYGAGVLGGGGGLISIRPGAVTGKSSAKALLIPLHLVRYYRPYVRKGKRYFRKTRPFGIDKEFEEDDPRVVEIGGMRYMFSAWANVPGQRPKRYVERAVARWRLSLHAALQRAYQEEFKAKMKDIKVEVRVRVRTG